MSDPSSSSAPSFARRARAVFDAACSECRDASRRLMRRPGPALFALLVLTGGFACFLFTLVMLRGIVLASPPYAQLDRLVHAATAQAGRPGLRQGLPGEEARALLASLDAFEVASEYARGTVVLRPDRVPEQVDAAFVGGDFFDTLGLMPSLGRALTPEDSAASPPVAVIGDALWRTRFAADPDVLGRVVVIDGHATTIVGVLPAQFDFQGAQLLLPTGPGDVREVMLIGRLAHGRSQAEVLERMQAHIANLPPERKGEGATAMIARVVALKAWIVGVDAAYFIGFMLLCATLVLVMAVVNVAHLQIAAMAVRLRELATRTALGGTRRRLFGGLALDAGLVAVGAMLLGLGLAHLAGLWLMDTVATAGDPMRPWMRTVVTPGVVVWAALAALAVTGLIALVAAWRLRHMKVETTLRGGGQVGVDSASARGGSLLTVIQVGLACVLLLSALVSVRLLAAVLSVESGVRADPARVVSAQVALPPGIAPDEAARRAEAIRERIAREPGVEAASLASVTPGRGLPGIGIAVDGALRDDGVRAVSAVARVDAHFAATLDFDIVGGRGFSAVDIAENRPVAVVDQAFVDTWFGGGDPVGRRIVLDPGGADARTVTVIGHTRALHPWTPDDLPSPDLLLPFSPRDGRFFTLTLRSAGDPATLMAHLPALVAQVDPDAPLQMVATQQAIANMERMGIQLLTQIFAAIAGIGLLLAGAGLYATLALGVARRTREIGLRRAIGASARSVALSVSRRGGIAVLAGMLLGCLAGAPLAYGLATQMQNAPGFDGLLFVAVLGTLAIAATLAMAVPVRRALRIAPMEALRHE